MSNVGIEIKGFQTNRISIVLSAIFVLGLVTASAQAPFSISAIPASQSIAAGASTIFTVVVNQSVGGTMYPVSAIPPNVIGGVARLSAGCTTCIGGAEVNQLLGHAADGEGRFTFNDISVPSAGTYDVTWFYHCGLNDGDGDTTCGGEPHPAGSACRPGIFTVDGAVQPQVQFACFAGPWSQLHAQTFPLPLEASATNSIEIYSKTYDAPDLDAILVASHDNDATVAISVSGAPVGMTATPTLTSVTGTDALTIDVTTSASVPKGTYPLVISGTSGATTLSATVTVVVGGGTTTPAFTITATPASQTIHPGNSTTYTATITGTGGFDGLTDLSVAGLPTGASGSFSPPSVTGSGSSTLTLTSNATTTPAGTYTLTITGKSGSVSHSATTTLIVTQPVMACVSVDAGAGWHNAPFTAQTGTFTVTYDATPSSFPTNEVIGLSDGPQGANTGFAVLVSFSDTGHILARNGGTYAATNLIAYAGGVSYHFRLVVNVPAHTYSVYVTAPGGVEQTVATNFAFRTEEAKVPSLNSFGGDAETTTGTFTYCDVTVTGN